jgi:hypothetical protein
MPVSLVFPRLAGFFDFVCRREKSTIEEFAEKTLPSITRQKLEEEWLNEYMVKNGIHCVDTKNSTTTR